VESLFHGKLSVDLNPLKPFVIVAKDIYQLTKMTGRLESNLTGNIYNNTKDNGDG